MVSIPDWSKFSRLHDGTTSREKNENLINKYHKQREEEVIRQAEKYGYFVTPTEDYLIDKCGPGTPLPSHPYSRKSLCGIDPSRKQQEEEVAKLKFVKLTNVHLRKIGDISFCLNLQICILHNNFLSKFDALAACRQLIKLDLHSNQISSIPGIGFWSSMQKLKWLHLHDNPLGKFEILNSLAACSDLITLTMHDTPISLKKNYRHHVVNSIWSLKALDHHVISDEEIIEDAEFGDRFSALHPALRIELCPYTPQNTTFEDERTVLRRIEGRINRLQAHHSPVLLIQRYIRGYLTRRQLTRHPHHRCSPLPKSVPVLQNFPQQSEAPPPPTSPTNDVLIPTDRTSETMGIDYDVYMKQRHPNSLTSCTDAPTSPSRIQAMESVTDPGDDHTVNSSSYKDPMTSSAKKKQLLINLSKLESETLQVLGDDPTMTTRSVYRDDSTEELHLKKLGRRKKKPTAEKKTEREKAKQIVKSVKQFFGPVVDPSPSPVSFSSENNLYVEDLPVTRFRLRGFKPRILLIDPMTEMILARREVGRNIRHAEADHHHRQLLKPKLCIAPQHRVNDDQRLFARAQGTMGMSCLFAVHKAYKDRDKSEKMAAKMEYIMAIKEERDRAKERIKLYQEERRQGTFKDRERDKLKLLDALERQELQRMNYVDKRNENRSKSSDAAKQLKSDLTFISDFANQHTSVSNALLRHDRQAKVDDQLQSKNDLVQGMKTTTKDQSDTVKKYMEHRQLMRQTETAMMRAALDTRMLNDANDRLLQARSRVAQVKARQATVQAFYPLPSVNSAPVTKSTRIGGEREEFTRWQTSLTTDGRLLSQQPIQA